MEIDEIWYGRFAIGHKSKFIICNFLRSVTPLRRQLKIARLYDDDAISHDPHVAQDKDRWRTLVNTVINLRVPQRTGNFLTS
jgi:hypothetical protein